MERKMHRYICSSCDFVFHAKAYKPCPSCGKKFPDQNIDEYVVRLLGEIEDRKKPDMGGNMYNMVKGKDGKD